MLKTTVFTILISLCFTQIQHGGLPKYYETPPTNDIDYILVNKIYVNDEVNMPYKFINRIRIKSVVNIFDDILKILEN